MIDLLCETFDIDSRVRAPAKKAFELSRTLRYPVQERVKTRMLRAFFDEGVNDAARVQGHADPVADLEFAFLVLARQECTHEGREHPITYAKRPRFRLTVTPRIPSMASPQASPWSSGRKLE